MTKMEAIAITYRASPHEITQRVVSRIRATESSRIVAFCHLRREERTFSLDNVLAASDPGTGEVVGNIWIACRAHLDHNGTELLASKLADVLPAVRVLKLFSQTTRGLGKRELSHIAHFIRVISKGQIPQDEPLMLWLRGYWCGDASNYRNGDDHEYKWLLRFLPHSQLAASRAAALAIAAGSQRTPIPPELLERIGNDFHGTM